MHVLIVDDSAVLRKLVGRALLTAGLDVSTTEAGDGQKALQQLRLAKTAGKSFDLIIADINMPIMDGFEFLEQRQREGLAPGVPAIIISSEDNRELVQRAAIAGVTGYLAKPFTAEQMSKCVSPVLGLTLSAR